jgi:transposase
MSKPSPNPMNPRPAEAAVPGAPSLGGHERIRRRWTPARKLQLVLETLQSDRQLAEICRREGLAPNLVYLWRKQLLGSAEAIFGPKPRGGVDPRTEKLAADNARMKSVIAEITAENLELKKTLWD